MYDQGLLTWQFPGMTNSVENISWSFIIIHLINRKTMIGGGGGGGGGGDFVTFSLFFVTNTRRFTLGAAILPSIYTNQTLFDLPGLVYGLKSKPLILSAK